MAKRLKRIPDFDPSDLSGNGLGYTGLTQIQPESLRNQVLHAYTSSLVVFYIVLTALAFVALLFGERL